MVAKKDSAHNGTWKKFLFLRLRWKIAIQTVHERSDGSAELVDETFSDVWPVAPLPTRQQSSSCSSKQLWGRGWAKRTTRGVGRSTGSWLMRQFCFRFFPNGRAPPAISKRGFSAFASFILFSFFYISYSWWTLSLAVRDSWRWNACNEENGLVPFAYLQLKGPNVWRTLLKLLTFGTADGNLRRHLAVRLC